MSPKFFLFLLMHSISISYYPWQIYYLLNYVRIIFKNGLLNRLCYFCTQVVCWNQLKLHFLEINICYAQLKVSQFRNVFFGVFTFFQKMNKNKSTSSKVKFVRSFFGRNVSLKKSFWICLTFSTLLNFGKRYKDDLKVIFDHRSKLHLGLDNFGCSKLSKKLKRCLILRPSCIKK